MNALGSVNSEVERSAFSLAIKSWVETEENPAFLEQMQELIKKINQPCDEMISRLELVHYLNTAGKKLIRDIEDEKNRLEECGCNILLTINQKIQRYIEMRNKLEKQIRFIVKKMDEEAKLEAPLMKLQMDLRECRRTKIQENIKLLTKLMDERVIKFHKGEVGRSELALDLGVFTSDLGILVAEECERLKRLKKLYDALKAMDTAGDRCPKFIIPEFIIPENFE